MDKKRRLSCVFTTFLIIFYTFFSSFTLPVSAVEYPMPNIENYPEGLDGAIAFIGDHLNRIAANTASDLQDAFIAPLNPEFGQKCQDRFGINPYDCGTLFYPGFSEYYQSHGNNGGGGYRDGSPTLDTNGSYSWNIPTDSDTMYIDDGCGGFLTVNCRVWVELPNYECYELQVFHKGKLVINESGHTDWYNSYPSNYGKRDPPEWHFGVYTVPNASNAIFYAYYLPGWGKMSSKKPFNPSKPFDSYYVDNKFDSKYGGRYWDADTYSYKIKDYSLPKVQNNSTTLYSYNPVTNNIENTYYYGADDNGQPCLYDNSNNVYNFNTDGTVGDTHNYLVPDFSTLNDNDFIALSNMVKNSYLQIYVNLLQQKDQATGNTGNGDLYPLLSNILSALYSGNMIDSNIQSLLYSINCNIENLGKNKTTAADNGDIIALLNALKLGLVGDGEPCKMDQIIDLLKEIAGNTAPSESDLEGDYEIEWYITTIPDLVQSKVDFSGYFVQLNNLLKIVFGNNYKGQDFSDYFAISQYMASSDTSEASVVLYTSDYPEVYGAELASADVPVEDSVYLSASLYSSGVTDDAMSAVPPSLKFTFMDTEYNLFECLTPEIYDKIQPFKTFLGVFLSISYYLWLVKKLPELVSDTSKAAK